MQDQANPEAALAQAYRLRDLRRAIHYIDSCLVQGVLVGASPPKRLNAGQRDALRSYRAKFTREITAAAGAETRRRLAARRAEADTPEEPDHD